MSMIKLAFLNFKSSFRNYLSLILSLAFTILIFLNFQNIIYSNALDVLGTHNKDYIDILIQVTSFVLGCFMFFFIWYSTNVFLTQRKKEIGIYVFMGLTNQKIGQLYMIETTMIGLSALLAGTAFGILTTQLFQMILLAISDISVDIEFRFQLQPILITAGIYLIIYLIFVLKGYVDIVKSSVLDMVSASRKNEYVRQHTWILLLKAILGTGITGSGYYLAVKDGGQEVMGNVLAAVILVVTGIYLLFGGLIPLIFQNLAKNKKFLYRKERTLWVNNLIFRIQKNYRTYAIVCVLMLCAVTALATSFAMKGRYENIVHFRNTYTFQVLSSRNDLEKAVESRIEQDNTIEYGASIPILCLDSSLFDTQFQNMSYSIISWSAVKQLAEDTGLEFDLKNPADDEIINVTHLYLLSLYTNRSNVNVTINGKSYQQINETSVPYLGYFQEDMSFYLVNDEEYERLLPLGEELYTYNYRIQNIHNFQASKEALNDLIGNTEEAVTGLVTIDPDSSDIEWIKVLYSICIFMFMVFVLASGSILFMKLYNDAFEEKERYQVLQKLGFGRKTLRKAAAHELLTSYAAPFLIMTLSSCFSVHALEKMMNTSLLSVHLVSVAIILVVFVICYWLSVSVYERNAGIQSLAVNSNKNIY